MNRRSIRATVGVVALGLLSFAASANLISLGGNGRVAIPSGDTTPDTFSFTDQSNVSTSATITSTAVTISGITAAITCSATGGTIDKNSAGSFASSQSISNNDTIRARHTSSASASTAANTVVNCNGVSDTFTSTTSSSSLLFADSFESGDKSHTENGIEWLASNFAVTVSTAIARTGTHSMRFQFGTSAEQRWSGSGTNYPEMWVSWYQYFPDGTETPSVGPLVTRNTGGNNKFVRVFAYGQSTGGMGSETFPDNIGGPAGNELANLEFAMTDGDTGIGGIDGSTDCHAILSPANRRRWFQIEFYFRPNTSHSSPNGAMTLYVDGNVCGTISGVNSQITPTVGIGAGYLWGSQNGFYTTDPTYIYVDDFKISVTGRTGT